MEECTEGSCFFVFACLLTLNWESCEEGKLFFNVCIVQVVKCVLSIDRESDR